MITGQTFHELYPKIIREVIVQGKTCKPRGMAVREILCHQFCLEDPTQAVPLQEERALNYPFSFMESVALFFPQSVTQNMLLWYVPKLAEYMNEYEGFKVWDANYGDRQVQANQMEECFKILKADPDSRRAVMSWYNPIMDLHDSKDIACTTTLHFLIRDGKLDFIVSMRGNDILLGLPQNVFMNTFLQRTMAAWLGVPVGRYFHRVNSLHAYIADIPKLTSIMESKKRITHEFSVMGNYGLKDQKTTNAQLEYLLNLDKISRDNKGKIAGTVGETLRAKLTPTLRQVYDTVLSPYYAKRFKK